MSVSSFQRTSDYVDHASFQMYAICEYHEYSPSFDQNPTENNNIPTPLQSGIEAHNPSSFYTLIITGNKNIPHLAE